MTADPCEYCAALDYGPEHESGTADHEAYWVDPDGNVEDEPSYVCENCMTSGHPDGPGYVTPARAERLRAERRRHADEYAADMKHDEDRGK